MSVFNRLATAFRGDVPFSKLPKEWLRRRRVGRHRAAERSNLKELTGAQARFSTRFATLTPSELLEHFKQKPAAFILSDVAAIHHDYFPAETVALTESARRIVDDSEWDLAGFKNLRFIGDTCWRRDPLGEKDWGLEYHADVAVYQDDVADIRVLWQLNRFGHAVTLAQAFAITKDERYAETFFSHVDSWMVQNPYGRGANWASAMEVALRLINLLAAFDILRRSDGCTEIRLLQVLQLFDQHGRFTLDNNEFTYISTSNHYLSNVIGLFWVGTFLPELENAENWRDLGLREMLGEMDKQILPDGSDFEASTGYHKFVTEMFLYSFLLADRNQIDIDPRYWDKLAKMLSYIQGIMRPDGGMPLIGDADGSQIIPLVNRDADDAAYLLGIGAVLFDRQEFKIPGAFTPEVLWLMGDKGAKVHGHLAFRKAPLVSLAFPDAGSYVMRQDDLYMHFNTSDCGVKGRGSHGHNDALSIEISAFGRPFIVDPGSYVYNLDRQARHMFRSTGYHSTVMVDRVEQNTTDVNWPFVIGNETRPAVLSREAAPDTDRLSAEHFGYERLPEPIRHRRTVEFNKADRYWVIEDLLRGKGEHEFSFRFHLSPDLRVDEIDRNTIQIIDDEGRRLCLRTSGIKARFELVPAFASRNYGHKEGSAILRWDVNANAPLLARFIVVPSEAHETTASKLELMNRLTDNTVN